MNSQLAKADAGKPKLTLVPRQIIFDIAEVREYGNRKYGNPENWKEVEVERYRDAAFRHFMAYLNDPQRVEEESGIEHLKHLEFLYLKVINVLRFMLFHAVKEEE